LLQLLRLNDQIQQYKGIDNTDQKNAVLRLQRIEQLHDKWTLGQRQRVTFGNNCSTDITTVMTPVTGQLIP